MVVELYLMLHAILTCWVNANEEPGTFIVPQFSD